jgi:hypothetical protein
VTTLGRLNFVNVNADGTYRASGNEQSTPDDIAKIADFLSSAQAPRKVVLHFHGGLVDENGGFTSAERIAPAYMAAGSHPIMVVWETGFLETLRASLAKIHQSSLFQKLLRVAIKNSLTQLGADIGKGPAQPPSDEEIDRALLDDNLLLTFDAAARGGAEIKTEAQAEQQRGAIENSVEEDLTAAGVSDADVNDEAGEYLKPSIRAEIGDEGGKGLDLLGLVIHLGSVVIAVVKRYVRKRSHGLYNTVIEEILREVYVANFGEWVWTSMKEAAARMWTSNKDVSGQNRYPGRDLLEGLAAAQKKQGIEVDLVGHSAGAIAIIELLRTVENEGIEIRFRNIAFLAPACTSDLFHSEIVAKPKRFERFRIYAMRDDLESKDALVQAVPFLYKSSLLYFISGVLEKTSDVPIAGMERYLSNTVVYTGSPFVEIRAFLQESGNDRLVLSKTGESSIDGLRCLAEHHGGFAEELQTVESLKHFIQ